MKIHPFLSKSLFFKTVISVCILNLWGSTGHAGEWADAILNGDTTQAKAIAHSKWLDHCSREEECTKGSQIRYRNHCPFCLYSVHLDITPGDRASSCTGLMKPMHLIYKSKKGWQIVHVCLKCSVKKACRVATDTDQPDSYKVLAFLNLSS